MIYKCSVKLTSKNYFLQFSRCLYLLADLQGLLCPLPQLYLSSWMCLSWWWIVCGWVAGGCILVAGGYDNCYDNRSTWTKVNHFLSSPQRFLWRLHFTFPLVMSISGWAVVGRTRCWLWPCVRSLVCSHPLSTRALLLPVTSSDTSTTGCFI